MTTKIHSETDEKMRGSLFEGLISLRAYDHYPLLCHDASFSFHLIEVLQKCHFPWSPVLSASYPSLVRLTAEHPDDVQHMVSFAESTRQRVVKGLQFPGLWDVAQATDAKSSFLSALDTVTDVAVGAYIEQGTSR